METMEKTTIRDTNSGKFVKNTHILDTLSDKYEYKAKASFEGKSFPPYIFSIADKSSIMMDESLLCEGKVKKWILYTLYTLCPEKDASRNITKIFWNIGQEKFS